MTQELWWMVLAASGLFVPMLLGLLPVARRRVAVRATNSAGRNGSGERR